TGSPRARRKSRCARWRAICLVSWVPTRGPRTRSTRASRADGRRREAQEDIMPEFSRRTITLASLATLATTLAPKRARAEKRYGPGVSDTEIKVGQTIAYSGPASAYGQLGQAEAAYFKAINDRGGINGRKINFISVDDSYSPPKAVEQTRRLVEQDEVAVMFGMLGTPLNLATRTYLNIKKVPQLFVAAGSEQFANPEKFPWTIGFQPTLRSEGIFFGKQILTANANPKIGVIYQ